MNASETRTQSATALSHTLAGPLVTVSKRVWSQAGVTLCTSFTAAGVAALGARSVEVRVPSDKPCTVEVRVADADSEATPPLLTLTLPVEADENRCAHAGSQIQASEYCFFTICVPLAIFLSLLTTSLHLNLFSPHVAPSRFCAHSPSQRTCAAVSKVRHAEPNRRSPLLLPTWCSCRGIRTPSLQSQVCHNTLS